MRDVLHTLSPDPPPSVHQRIEAHNFNWATHSHISEKSIFMTLHFVFETTTVTTYTTTITTAAKQLTSVLHFETTYSHPEPFVFCVLCRTTFLHFKQPTNIIIYSLCSLLVCTNHHLPAHPRNTNIYLYIYVCVAPSPSC